MRDAIEVAHDKSTTISSSESVVETSLTYVSAA